jgi:hypothetical protein
MMTVDCTTCGHRGVWRPEHGRVEHSGGGHCAVRLPTGPRYAARPLPAHRATVAA